MQVILEMIMKCVGALVECRSHDVMQTRSGRHLHIFTKFPSILMLMLCVIKLFWVSNYQFMYEQQFNHRHPKHYIQIICEKVRRRIIPVGLSADSPIKRGSQNIPVACFVFVWWRCWWVSLWSLVFYRLFSLIGKWMTAFVSCERLSQENPEYLLEQS